MHAKDWRNGETTTTCNAHTAHWTIERRLHSPATTQHRQRASPRSNGIRQAADLVKGLLRRQRTPPLTRFLACRKISNIGVKHFLKSRTLEVLYLVSGVSFKPANQARESLDCQNLQSPLVQKSGALHRL
jgi:hypothetical protein